MSSRSSSSPAWVLGRFGRAPRLAARAALVGAVGLVALGTGPSAASVQPGTGTASIPTLRTQWGPSFGGERVFAKPKRDAAMGFSLSTQVMEISVRQGEAVRQGQVLMRGDDREEVSRLTQQVHRADSVLQIERAQAAADLAEVEYQRNLEAFGSGGATQLEVDRARLAMVTSKIDVQIATWSQEQERYLADLTQARVERFRLTAPFDGVVDSVSVDLGDAVRETDPLVRIVDLTELWMDVPTPPSEVLRLSLREGSPAWVMIELGDRPIVARGQVINITPTADGASGKQTVRVSVTNTGAWPSGLDTWVRFTEPASEWMGLLTAHAARLDTSPLLADAGPAGERPEETSGVAP